LITHFLLVSPSVIPKRMEFDRQNLHFNAFLHLIKLHHVFHHNSQFFFPMLLWLIVSLLLLIVSHTLVSLMEKGFEFFITFLSTAFQSLVTRKVCVWCIIQACNSCNCSSRRRNRRLMMVIVRRHDYDHEAQEIYSKRLSDLIPKSSPTGIF